METIYLLVTIDTEEDSWGFAANNTCHEKGETCAVENVFSIPKVQKIFDEFSIRPVYLCNAPVIENQKAVELLRDLLRQNKCEIGGHIHPWNTFPIKEEINEDNSQIKNLSPTLIKKKLKTITETIVKNFDTHPKFFRAGRWGMNHEVLKAIKELGYEIDTSVTPYTSWEGYGNGADFTRFPDQPYYINLSHGIAKPAPKPGDILEVPVSIGFNRTNFALSHAIHSLVKHRFINRSRLSGVLHRTGMLKKIWLSPELNSFQEMASLSNTLLKREINLFNFTFHSTSLLPEKSPFVSSETDLIKFLHKIRQYLSWLTSRGNVVSVTSTELLDLVGHGQIKSCRPENDKDYDQMNGGAA